MNQAWRIIKTYIDKNKKKLMSFNGNVDQSVQSLILLPDDNDARWFEKKTIYNQEDTGMSN